MAAPEKRLKLSRIIVGVGGVLVAAALLSLFLLDYLPPVIPRQTPLETIIVRIECAGCDVGSGGVAWTGVVSDSRVHMEVKGNTTGDYRFDRKGEQFWAVSVTVQKTGVQGTLKATFLTPEGRVIREASSPEPYGTIQLSWPFEPGVY